jgi:hypothetical protein
MAPILPSSFLQSNELHLSYHELRAGYAKPHSLSWYRDADHQGDPQKPHFMKERFVTGFDITCSMFYILQR